MDELSSSRRGSWCAFRDGRGRRFHRKPKSNRRRSIAPGGKSWTTLKLKALLKRSPRFGAGAILTINARDGGTDANDWADMLLRMYSAWAVQGHDYKIELLDRQRQRRSRDQPARRSPIRGPMAYGYLKGRRGRCTALVRISPFNSESKRQTSFAAVSVSLRKSTTVDRNRYSTRKTFASIRFRASVVPVANT